MASPFLALPLEIREIVYKLLLPNPCLWVRRSAYCGEDYWNQRGGSLQSNPPRIAKTWEKAYDQKACLRHWDIGGISGPMDAMALFKIRLVNLQICSEASQLIFRSVRLWIRFDVRFMWFLDTLNSAPNEISVDECPEDDQALLEWITQFQRINFLLPEKILRCLPKLHVLFNRIQLSSRAPQVHFAICQFYQYFSCRLPLKTISDDYGDGNLPDYLLGEESVFRGLQGKKRDLWIKKNAATYDSMSAPSHDVIFYKIDWDAYFMIPNGYFYPVSGLYVNCTLPETIWPPGRPFETVEEATPVIY